MLTMFWVLFTVAVLIIITSLIMAPSANAFSGALVGSADLELFKDKKERGHKIVIKWVMFSLGISLMAGTIIVRALM